jgi:general stress protein 26
MMRKDYIPKLRSLLQEAKICMFSTRDTDGSLHSRPMAFQELDDTGNIWFFTRKTGVLGDEISVDDRVNLSCGQSGQYLSISGRAAFLHDRAKTEELWNVLYRAWYPKGIDDPDLQLMRVTLDKAEHWESSNSVFPIVYGAIKATLTGTEAKMGEHDRMPA